MPRPSRYAESALWLLAPLFWLQGRWVRWRTPQLPEAPGPRLGSQGEGSALSLLILGDSAAAGVGIPHRNHTLVGHLVNQLACQHRVQWQLLAQSGLTTEQALPMLAQVQTPPDLVIVSLGVNDILSVRSARRWQVTLSELIQSLQQQGQPKILLTALPPMERFPRLPWPLNAWLGMRCRGYNRALVQLIQQHNGVRLLTIPDLDADLAPDQFHPGPNTHRLWADAALLHCSS
ncbi:SGNH/GDSL hydrolase family protein [Ferrimonas marina]|uniref:Lysophospholipase L1 n=1 Tax=Ferrimonas marina TaxID=299255 RepID=A0A1M5YV61_9GAMM|nr:SGNH/GDSL hydrolase family protein [Ferrimonas marina]SHI15738.1 Lysophospholipase L1 [Ferrimonas marina]